MIREDQQDFIEEITDVMVASDVELGDMLEPLIFILTDVAAQMTEQINSEFIEDVCKMVHSGYMAQFMIADCPETCIQH